MKKIFKTPAPKKVKFTIPDIQLKYTRPAKKKKKQESTPQIEGRKIKCNDPGKTDVRIIRCRH